MSTPRGRAASPIRPGLITKQVLLGDIPLETGELVEEAAITDLHSAYKAVLGRHNLLRPRAKRIKGMNHSSFYTMFKFAQLLGLVELVRTEPMKFPPPGGNLYSIEKTDEVRVVIAVRTIFRLTGVGKEDEKHGLNLTTAWKENWPAPQKVAALPPTEVTPVPEKPEKPVKEPLEAVPEGAIPVFKMVGTPSQKQYSLLLKHLLVLESLDQTRGDVVSEIDNLATRIGDWAIEIEDSLGDAKIANNTRLITRLTREAQLVNMVFEGLLDASLRIAIAALSDLIVKP